LEIPESSLVALPEGVDVGSDLRQASFRVGVKQTQHGGQCKRWT